MVLFGGVDWQSGAVFPETWTWNGSSWTRENSASAPPIGRLTPNIAFDDARGEVVLFFRSEAAGGPTQDPPTFTWTWNGSEWTQRHPSTSPPHRFDAAMAYDAKSKKIVLFGGLKGLAPVDKLNDTWSWDGVNWTAERPKTLPRPGPAYAAYDGTRNQLVMLTADGTTWAWVSGDWVKLGSTTLLGTRLGAQVTYDARLGKVVLYGGADTARPGPSGIQTVILNDLWSWDGTSWTRLWSQAS